MLEAGVDKAHRDLILGHSLKSMDVHCLAPIDDMMRQVIKKYTKWFGSQLEVVFGNVDQSVDQALEKETTIPVRPLL